MTEFVITELEFSKLMKVQPNTIRTWVKRGLIPQELIFKLPNTKKGTIRFIKDKVFEWIMGGGINGYIQE